ncbi:protein delta homolog 2 isoform X1 [Takifugu rubripes]|nr:protein delta homolog 2 isoform X1 [Takifugu rubripes]
MKNDMRSVRTAASLLLLFCYITVILVAPLCTGQGGACSCNDTNSRCDDSGVCRCDPGWEGEQCERCVPKPGCRHGSCQQPWQCNCETGWGGRFCDKDLSVCSEKQPCRHGATCVIEDNGEYACMCPEGFYGRNCELRAGPCHQRRSPCKNGGLCEDANGFAEELTCHCLAGFTGRRCENDVDDCLMRPCANGATCLDGVNRFSCVCPAGFSGRFCTINRDDCISQPCLNGGRCIDLVGSFHCICQPGYTGATCETLLRATQGREGNTFRSHKTTENKNEDRGTGNSSNHGDRLLVSVSERGGGLSEVQLVILLILATITLGAVALTSALILHGRCQHHDRAPCCTLTSMSSHKQQQKTKRQGRSDEQECRISFLNVAEAERKKTDQQDISHIAPTQMSESSRKGCETQNCWNDA